MATTTPDFTRPGLKPTGDVRLLIRTLPGKKENSSNRFFKKADRVHQIKLLHTSPSKSIIWEIFEVERHESKSANKSDYNRAISLQSGSQFQRKTPLEMKLVRQN